MKYAKNLLIIIGLTPYVQWLVMFGYALLISFKNSGIKCAPIFHGSPHPCGVGELALNVATTVLTANTMSGSRFFLVSFMGFAGTIAAIVALKYSVNYLWKSLVGA